ncbi:MAG: four-helix bundle copper-binding protein [Thermomicrobiaceae bacterium]|nr:four-helix bundle copper-binding protein [Thermomicrobiaceae bacterium]
MAQHAHGSEMSDEMRRCIQLCTECHQVCLETIAHCLQLGGPHAEEAHIRVLLDCAEICQTSANFMLRHSPLHSRVCAVCGDTCERCAEDCERFPDDEQMRRCAEICRRCADSCHRMAGLAA